MVEVVESASRVASPAVGPTDRQPLSVDRPTVVMVLASARSGTTLLGGLLDLHPGVTFVGELNRRRGWLERQGTCGCGLSYAECPVWAPLAARPSFASESGRAEPADRRATAPDIRELQASVRRPAAVIRALLGLPTARQCRYVAYLEQLYRDIAAQGATPVIVDTSKKNLVDILLCTTIGSLPFEVVHLHRDPRGVLASRLRGARRKSRGGGGHHPLAARLGAPIVVRDALAWDRANGLGLLLARRSRRRVVRLPYEDLVADSSGTVGALLDQVGLDPAELADAWSAPDMVDFPTNHSMAGNRTRHTRGPTPLVADDRWRDDLHPAFRVVVEALTAPVRRGLRRPAPPRR
jgi:hypothetical protein